VLDNNGGLVIVSSFNLEWPELAVILNSLVLKFPSDQSFGIEDSVGGVSGGLVLSSVSDESLVLGEGDVRGRGIQTLVVGDNFYLVIHPHSNAGVGGA